MNKYLLCCLISVNFLVFNEAKALDYYLLAGSAGEPRFTAEWTLDPTGLVALGTPVSFTGGHTWHIQNRASVILTAGWTTLDAGSIVIIGSGLSSTTLDLDAAGGSITTLAVVDMSASSSLIVNRDTQVNLRNLDNSSTVMFAASITGAIPPVDYGNLIISAANTLGNKVGGTTINSVLTLNADLTLGSNKLNIGGTVAGSSNFVGDLTGAEINVNSGTTNVGTLNFAGGSRVLTKFTMAHASASGIIILGTDLAIGGSGFFTQTTGNIDLNGNTLRIMNTANLTLPSSSASGVIKGSANSAFQIEAVTLSGSLFMDPSANTLKALTLNSVSQSLGIGDKLIIADSLTVTDGALTTNGNVTLTATGNLKGRLGRVGASASLNGALTVETFIPGSTTGWANMGSSGLFGPVIGNLEGQIPITCKGCIYAPSSMPGNFFSITGWNEAIGDYDTTITWSTAMTPGKGFWVYIGSGPTTTTDFVLRSTGSPGQGNGTIPITRTSGTNSANDGYNLVANPYASPISWTKLLGLNAGKLTGTIYGWNADVGGGAGSSFVGGVSTPNAATSIGDILPAGQGFYVESILSSSSLFYNETIKMPSNTSSNSLQRTAAAEIGDVFHLRLKGSADWDETAFRIHPEASPVFDYSWDARKIFQSPGYIGYPGSYSKYTTISSRDFVNQDYSIQSIPPLTQQVRLPLLVRVSTSGTYTISASGMENIHDCVTLKDNLLNTTHDLKTGSYIFQISDTTSSPRFEIVLCRDKSINLADISEEKVAESVNIGQDQKGAFVKTAFSENTKGIISAYNLLGQKLMEDVTVEGTATSTYLNLQAHNQVVLIKVVTDKEVTTKKMVLH